MHYRKLQLPHVFLTVGVNRSIDTERLWPAVTTTGFKPRYSIPRGYEDDNEPGH
jgi:hypothetical protein